MGAFTFLDTGAGFQTDEIRSIYPDSTKAGWNSGSAVTIAPNTSGDIIDVSQYNSLYIIFGVQAAPSGARTCGAFERISLAWMPPGGDKTGAPFMGFTIIECRDLVTPATQQRAWHIPVRGGAMFISNLLTGAGGSNLDVIVYGSRRPFDPSFYAGDTLWNASGSIAGATTVSFPMVCPYGGPVTVQVGGGIAVDDVRILLTDPGSGAGIQFDARTNAGPPIGGGFGSTYETSLPLMWASIKAQNIGAGAVGVYAKIIGRPLA